MWTLTSDLHLMTRCHNDISGLWHAVSFKYLQASSVVSFKSTPAHWEFLLKKKCKLVGLSLSDIWKLVLWHNCYCFWSFILKLICSVAILAKPISSQVLTGFVMQSTFFFWSSIFSLQFLSNILILFIYNIASPCFSYPNFSKTKNFYPSLPPHLLPTQLCPNTSFPPLS